MEIGDFIRNIGVHLRGVALGALLIALAAAGFSMMSPNPYTTSSTLRVIPPAGSLDTDLLSTAVDWYAALGQVPDILSRAAARTEPPVTPSTLRKASTLTPGAGPGELLITVTGENDMQALSMNNALGQVLVRQVDRDENLQLGGTRLSILVPAEDNRQLGSGAVSLFVTAFLAAFVLLATAAGVLHNYINWRINKRVLRALGAQESIPAFTAVPELGVFLATHARRGLQTWMGASANVDAEAWASLEAQVNELGGGVTLLPVTDNAVLPAGDFGTVYVPQPNDASPQALAAAALAAVPALVLIPQGCRLQTMRTLLERMSEVDIPVLALALADKRLRSAGR